MILEGKSNTFKLDKLLSKGKYSWTYSGESNEGDRVFVKRFNATSGSAALFGFVQEAQLSFDHPNLLGPCELIRRENALFQVRPFLPGQTLEAILSDRRLRKQLTANHVKTLFKDILNACETLHARHVIHRDIKPANILLNDLEGEFKATLLDYGQAKIKGKADPRPCPFTMIYSSPEQVLKIGPLVDENSDLFSLGIVMSEILSGKPPYSSNHPIALMNLQIGGELQNVQSVPKEWRDIISKMCVKPTFRMPPNQLPPKELKQTLKAAKAQRYQTVKEIFEMI